MRPAVATFLLLSYLPLSASAQLLSPGKLARPHADLEGLKSCTKCHEAGSRLSEKKCLGCHSLIERRVDGRRGYHAQVRDRPCQKCHADHRGEDFQMVTFGPKGASAFDHESAGYRLEGAHQKVDCEKCHDPRLIADPDVRALLQESAKKLSYLGLSTKCAKCHFDEHRGQLSEDCESCHSLDDFKDVRFDHDRARYTLEGAHVKVDCEKCHAIRADARASAFPAPKSGSYSHYRPLEFEACTACHEDPHSGRFGKKCEKCHDTESWSKVRMETQKVEFHDRTRYPLTGLHRTVPCAECHGPKKGLRVRWKDLAFDRCDRCHPDGHGSQLQGDCEGCHGTAGFVPSGFERERHAKSPYALQGGHLAVACGECHEKAAPAGSQAGSALVSMRRFRFDSTECRTCHEDPHRRQLEPRACESCHEVSSFSALHFDHDKDTDFPLTGRHRQSSNGKPLRCALCHELQNGVVAYRGTPTSCSACHTDEHRGQLEPPPADARAEPSWLKTACARCHSTTAWKPATFSHDDPRFTTYVLEGAHAKLKCSSCHLADGSPTSRFIRYRGLSRTCARCHVDPHRGRMRRYEPR
ncbi:MAG: hypothetical protein HYV07_22740 [Deltaproteobacteria bacterium]|nr:hypothetical protein [Deltaproteobacteria bacterium]